MSLCAESFELCQPSVFVAIRVCEAERRIAFSCGTVSVVRSYGGVLYCVDGRRLSSSARPAQGTEKEQVLAVDVLINRQAL